MLDRLQARARQAAARGQPRVEAWLDRHGCRWVAPDGCPFGFVRLPDGVTGEALHAATAESGACAVPGSQFDGLDDHVRLSFHAPSDVLDPALAALGTAIDGLVH